MEKPKYIRKFFITGLVILLPLAVTVAVIAFLVNFFTAPFVGIVTKTLSNYPFFEHGFLFLSKEKLILYISKITILIVLFIVTVILGMITRWFLIKSLLNLSDKILHRIPVVNTVYKTTQDIIKTIFVSDKNSFQQAVLVPFPRDGSYVVGLIARESPRVCSEMVGEELVSVLVPTTPNPTTGFLLMYPKKNLIYIDLRPEDAIKFIISCGVVIPGEKRPSETKPS